MPATLVGVGVGAVAWGGGLLSGWAGGASISVGGGLFSSGIGSASVTSSGHFSS